MEPPGRDLGPAVLDDDLRHQVRRTPFLVLRRAIMALGRATAATERGGVVHRDVHTPTPHTRNLDANASVRGLGCPTTTELHAAVTAADGGIFSRPAGQPNPVRADEDLADLLHPRHAASGAGLRMVVARLHKEADETHKAEPHARLKSVIRSHKSLPF